jgi:hypothetical protein
MKHVRILKHTHGLNPTEEAGFEDAVADALVESGHAEIFDFKLPKQSKKELEQAAVAAAEQKAAEDKLVAEQAAAELAANEAAASANKGK